MSENERRGLSKDDVAANWAKVARTALPVLVGRLGGSVTVSTADLDELASRYGGKSRMSLRMEGIGDGSTVRLTLVRKEPEQGDLPV